MIFNVITGFVIIYSFLTIIVIIERYYGANDEIGGKNEFK